MDDPEMRGPLESTCLRTRVRARRQSSNAEGVVAISAGTSPDGIQVPAPGGD
jgi:hypothetical protein